MNIKQTTKTKKRFFKKGLSNDMQHLLHRGHSKTHPAEENCLPAGDHCTAMRSDTGKCQQCSGAFKRSGPTIINELLC